MPILKGMSRSEQRARVYELSQTLAAAILVAAAGFLVLAINGWVVGRFEAQGMELPFLTQFVVSVPWLGLLLLPLFVITVLCLAVAKAPRGVASGVSLLFSLLAGAWIVIAIFAYSMPVIRLAP
jgi:hypothetical protein